MTTEAATKVRAPHLSRNAYLYVRQSTLRQVLNNTESTVRQYDLRQRAVALGWPADQVVVVDVDQGHSGASAADREGFQRLVADVSMGRAGIVLGLECSRLARNNADWHRLLEICALTGTLICDEDGLYDPADFNDRMLLGLKGTLSEAELHFIRARLRGGQLSKARRGELPMALPVGFVNDPAGKAVLDPDAGVQQALRHLFATFARAGSARAVVQTFNVEGLRFPTRVRRGRRKANFPGRRCATRGCCALHNPHNAGAFAYGRVRCRHGPGRQVPVKRSPRDRGRFDPRCAPLINWETFELNQKLLAGNAHAHAHGSERAKGPAREGPALLQGLAVCGRCGCRMTVAYHLRAGVEVPEYRCMRAAVQDGRPACSQVPGASIDAAIGALLLETVTPLALEVALTVQAELEARVDEADALRSSHVERRATAPSWPGVVTLLSTPTTASSLTASRPTGTTPSVSSEMPKTITNERAQPKLRSVKSRSRASGRWPPTSPGCGPTQRHRRGSANAWPVCSSKTSRSTSRTGSALMSGSGAGKRRASPSRSR